MQQNQIESCPTRTSLSMLKSILTVGYACASIASDKKVMHGMRVKRLVENSSCTPDSLHSIDTALPHASAVCITLTRSISACFRVDEAIIHNMHSYYGSGPCC